MVIDQNQNLDDQKDLPVDLQPDDSLDQDIQGEDQDSTEAKFSKAQMQQIGSMVGRLIKEQIKKTVETDVLPVLSESTRRIPQNNSDDDMVSKLDQELSEAIFGGKPLSAISKVIQLSQQAQTNLGKTKQQQVDKMLVSYVEKPLYKEIFPMMKTIAEDAVQNKGYPISEAVEYAYQLARADHYEKKLNPDLDEGDLGLLKGGKYVKRSGSPKLPPNFQKAYERDKAKGLFKSEQEYIDCLSPQVRKQYGI